MVFVSVVGKFYFHKHVGALTNGDVIFQLPLKLRHMVQKHKKPLRGEGE